MKNPSPELQGLVDAPTAVILKTPQSIVHIKHRISLQQYKYWVLLLQELRQQFEEGIKPDEEGFYAMPMAKFSDLIGYTPRKSEIWNDLNSLKNETIAFNVLNKDKEKEKYGAGFISEWKVSNSFVRFKFPSFLENVMRGLSDAKAMFALINWEIFNHFTGKYEAIIYKLCKDYIGSQWKRTPDMTLSQFREYMGLKETEYLQFEDLNKRCIKGAVKSINDSEISDILVTPHLYREGRRVTGLYFSVESKNQSSLPFTEFEEENPFKFAKVPISPNLQKEYLEIRPSKEEIALCIQRANEYGEGLEKAGKVATYGAIYRKAIGEGWHEQQARANAKRASKQALKKAEAEEQSEQERQEKERNTKIAQDIQDALCRFWLLSQEEQEGKREQFKQRFLPTAGMRKEWDEDIKNGKKPEEKGKFRALFYNFLKDT